MSQGGEFMENKQKADPANKKFLDQQELQIYDARPALGKLEIDKHGIVIANLKTKMPETLEVLFEEKDTQIRSIYWPEVEELAKKTIVNSEGRLPKYAFAIGTQKFTEDKSRGILGSYARTAHADFSEVVFDNAYKMLTKRGVPEEEAQNLDIMFINAWKPFGQTVKDNAFAILDWNTVDPENDVHIMTRGAPTIKGNIYGSQITYNPNHRWVYMPNQTSEELWLFKQADSRSRDKKPHSLAQYAFHISIRLPDDDGTARSRRSIALRLVLGYEKKPKAAL